MSQTMWMSLPFLAAGGILGMFALAMIVGAYRFRRSATKAIGTVTDSWVQAITRRGLEGVYREGGPRAHAGSRRTYASRTRWIKFAYSDAAGVHREATRLVYGKYSPGDAIRLLLPPNRAESEQVDSLLDSYGRAAVVGVMSIIFILLGACIWSGVISLG